MRYFFLGCLLSVAITAKAQVTLNFIQKKSGSDLTYFCVVEEFDEMMGFQSTLTWNPDTMAYSNIEFSEYISTAMVNPKMVNKGQLPLIWITTEGPLSLKPCDTVFTISFRDKLGLSSLTFGDEPVRTEFVDMDGIVGLRSDIVATCGLMTSTRNQITDIRFRVSPNIIEGGRVYRVWSNARKPLDLVLIDGQGQEVDFQKDMIGKPLNAPEAAGLYFYAIRDGKAVLHTGKLVVY